MNSARWRIKAEELTQRRERDGLRQSLPDEIGVGHSRLVQLDQDLSCIETIYAPSRDLAILSRIDDQEPRLVLTLGLKGQSRFVDGGGGEVMFNEGFATITAFNSSVGERQYQGNQSVTQLRLSMSKQWLERHFGESGLRSLLPRNGVQVLSYLPISPQGVIASQRLRSHKIDNELGRMFVHGQALTLLASELAPLIAGEKGVAGFSQRDRVMANQARDILFQEFQQPPSVGALAKRVGTNPFKLKRLFHHFFQDTPYGLLLQFRMNKAYEFLESTRCPVHIAANLVGYHHASNFTAAFTRYFGIPPKKIARSRELTKGAED